MKYLISAFTNFSFTGRVSRKEFWWFYLNAISVCIGWAIFFTAVAAELELDVNSFAALIPFVPVVILFLPILSMEIKRLHDVGRSDWWVLASFVPVIGTIVLFILFVRKGDPEPNRYGPAPVDYQTSASVGLKPVVIGLAALCILLCIVCVNLYVSYYEVVTQNEKLTKEVEQLIEANEQLLDEIDPTMTFSEWAREKHLEEQRKTYGGTSDDEFTQKFYDALNKP